MAAIVWSLALLFAFGVSYLSGIGWGWAIVIVAGALIINGIAAEIEDRAPGGFLNPRSKKGPD